MESKIDPIISIIIPTYNSEKFIFKCIESIPINKKIEVLLIDDFSKKNLKRKIDLKKFTNFKIIRNNSNLGPGMSRNLGIKKSKGRYILFLDSDDYLKKTNLLKLIHSCKISEVDIIFCRYNKDHYPKDNLFFLKTIKNSIGRQKLLKKIISKNYPIDECWSILFKREFLIKRNILFPKNIRIAEDEYFLAKVLTEFKYAKTFNNTIYIHNDRKNSLSSDLSDFNSHLDFIKLFYLFLKLHVSKKYKLNEKKLLIRYTNVLYARIISLMFLRKNIELIKISKLIKKNNKKEIYLVLNSLNLSHFKKFIEAKTKLKLKVLIQNYIDNFKIKFGVPKSIFIYCKSLIARSLIKVCENLNIEIIAVIDDAKIMNNKFENYKLINFKNFKKLVRKYSFNYKIFVTNNRKLTFEKIRKKLVSYKINTKNIIHYY